MDDESETVTDLAAFITLSCGYLLLKKVKKKRRPRRWWVTSFNNSKNRYRGTDMLIDLLKEPSGYFENFCRMSAEDFEYLLSKIEPRIAKKDTQLRPAIPAKERLAITLRFLASGDSYKSLHYLFKISPQIISKIVPEVCTALLRELEDLIKMPSTENEWKQLATDYDNQWNFPHCLGAIDGKHVMIQSPMNSGSEYYNYKNYFSVVLLALVDANYCFSFVDCGTQGRLSDGAVFKNCLLFEKLETEQLNVPPSEEVNGTKKKLPYVFVADDAFGLNTHIMKPFQGIYIKGSTERVFNYRLSRARRVVENVFGIMSSVFRVLRKPMLLQPNKVALVTMTCCYLHNFLRRSKNSQDRYIPPGTLDLEVDGNIIPGNWREDQSDITSLRPLRKVPRKPTLDAKKIREDFAQYFMNEGQVTWQSKYC